MPHNLYYIDSIYQQEENDLSEGYITLISTDADENGRYIPATIPFTRIPHVIDDEGNSMVATENTYVYLRNYEQGGEIRLENGNNSQYALLQFQQMADLRQRLHAKYGDMTDSLTKDEYFILAHPTEIYSYHVNVGHGNCTFIIIISGNRHLVWMVDSSVLEARWMTKNFIDHKSDLDCCIRDIASILKIRIRDLHINRFFLTHPHYDHYNGIFYLRNKGLMDDETVYYINYYFDCSNEWLHDFLEELYQTNARIVEPISSKGIWPFILILHPECRIYKKGDVASSVDVSPKREVSNVNNSSVLYDFFIGCRTMVFPGDLQLYGFNKMSKVSGCCNMPQNPDYYAISHHGSGNGHPFQKCQSNKYGYPIVCMAYNAKKAILMGKDGVYSGIFHKDVIRFFNHHSKLETTDMVSGPTILKYLRLNWLTGQVLYEF